MEEIPPAANARARPKEVVRAVYLSHLFVGSIAAASVLRGGPTRRIDWIIQLWHYWRSIARFRWKWIRRRAMGVGFVGGRVTVSARNAIKKKQSRDTRKFAS